MAWLKRLAKTWRAISTSSEMPKLRASEHALATSSAPNLVDGMNVLADYYRFVEAEAYDAGLKTMREHREFRPEFLERMHAVLGREDDENACELIGAALRKDSTVFSDLGTPQRDAAHEARSRDPKGYALLKLSAPLTLDGLKGAYRRAALVYHPDVGGDNETMRRINSSYELFSAVLRHEIARDAVSTRIRIDGNVTSFFERVRFAELEIFVDDLDADSAFGAYTSLTLEQLKRQPRPWEALAKLSKLLAACRRTEDAKRVLGDLKTLVEFGERRQLILRPLYERTLESCADAGKITFSGNHPRLAGNLLRHGIIDRSRYDAMMKKISVTDQKGAEDTASVEEFLRTYRFVKLPMEPALTNGRAAGLVPAPGYYTRVEDMTREQKAEYALAFQGGDAELAVKYFPIRIEALMRSVFVGYDRLEDVSRELHQFAAMHGTSGGIRFYCKEAAKLVDFFIGLDPKARAKRIALLKDLDGPVGRVATITVSGQGVSMMMPRPIMLNPFYIEFAIGPIERIERYAKTGSELTPAEEAEQRTRRVEFARFQDSRIYKRARDAVWKDKTPEAIAAALPPLCDALFDHAAKPHGESLEIGYWIDKLTIALVKLKRFEEARRWIQRYDHFPIALKRRDADGVIQSLQKRKLRCESFSRKG